MRSALNALPADGREMLLLARLRELPYTDIAEMYGVSVSAVKMRIHRALVSLHEELNDESRHDL
jgi:RNA polymerase sigma factor (sigma-70 family)